MFSCIAGLESRKEADAIVIPFWEKQKKAKAAALVGSLEKNIHDPLETKDFKGREGEIFFLYQQKQKEKRILLLGLGKDEKLSVESLRRAYCQLAKFCQKNGLQTINLILPTVSELRKVSVEECLQGICEGILLTNYRWAQKSNENGEIRLLKKVTLIGVLPKQLPTIEQFEKLAESVYFARDLINGNADIVTPQYLAEAAKKISGQFPTIRTTIFDKKHLEKEKMGLLLAVGRGSPHPPLLIQMRYSGNPGSKDHTVLVGKGITFDTGGLCLKPGTSMETMRDDMSGAAAVMGAVVAAASLKLKVNVTAVVPAAENAIDGNSYKVGDIYKSYSGKTVEIKDTDAEGRLALADAFTHAIKHLQPTRMIDLATLTGAMVISLGEGMSGFMCNDDTLAKRLLESSEATSELLWRLPLHEPYKELLKSDTADLKNTGGRPGGSITAALFLEEFVENTPWAHIDIAGTAFSTKERHYWPKNGVGFGVRLLVDFLKKLEKQGSSRK